MAARCFVDTCGITWSEVVTGSGPGFQAEAELEPGGGLQCTEDEGLGVNMLDETAAAVVAGRECANILRKTAAGELHALIPQARTYTFTGGMRSIPNTGVAAGSSLGPTVGETITNNTGCAALLVLRGQFEVNWEVADTVGGAVPALNADYNALLQASLMFNGTPVDVQYISVGGRKPVAGQMYLKEWRDISYIQAMTAGQVITITDSLLHDLSEGDAGIRRNFAANLATTPPNFHTGYRVVVTASILPIGSIVGT